MEAFPLIVGIVGTVIIGLIASVVVWRMWTNQIDLSQLLSDSPTSSLSRFQFLVFTFIIGLSYLLLVLCRVCKTDVDILPNIPPGALALIGISAGSYVLGKGIQKAADTSVRQAELSAQSPAANPQAPTGT
jgi:uncharacterized BrkB/YihY/UPF0761 family membrane protein